MVAVLQMIELMLIVDVLLILMVLVRLIMARRYEHSIVRVLVCTLLHLYVVYITLRILIHI